MDFILANRIIKTMGKRELTINDIHYRLGISREDIKTAVISLTRADVLIADNLEGIRAYRVATLEGMLSAYREDRAANEPKETL